jgi:motility quorum-sensing regulator / GCU-specific mRNA interferase toxin
MEKHTPHCKLSFAKMLVEARRVNLTSTARVGATALGFGFEDVLDVLMALKSADFYKSMTTYEDHRVWQDVYRPKTRAGDVYLKFSIVKLNEDDEDKDAMLVVSFKEL